MIGLLARLTYSPVRCRPDHLTLSDKQRHSHDGAGEVANHCRPGRYRPLSQVGLGDFKLDRVGGNRQRRSIVERSHSVPALSHFSASPTASRSAPYCSRVEGSRGAVAVGIGVLKVDIHDISALEGVSGFEYSPRHDRLQVAEVDAVKHIHARLYKLVLKNRAGLAIQHDFQAGFEFVGEQFGIADDPIRKTVMIPQCDYKRRRCSVSRLRIHLHYPAGSRRHRGRNG